MPEAMTFQKRDVGAYNIPEGRLAIVLHLFQAAQVR